MAGMGVRAGADVAQRRLWLAAGWLAIAFVVATFASTPAYTSTTTGIGDGPSKLTKALVTSSMTTGYVGAYGELVASLIFLVGALLVARLLRGEGDVGAWLSSCMSGAAVAYVAISIAVGASSAGAVYAGHHGTPVLAAAAVADAGSFGFGLSGAAAGIFVLAASAAGQTTGRLPRWFCVMGYVVGVVLIAGVPAISTGAPQMMLWFVWFVALGVLALRRARRATVGAAVSAGAPA